MGVGAVGAPSVGWVWVLLACGRGCWAGGAGGAAGAPVEVGVRCCALLWASTEHALALPAGALCQYYYYAPRGSRIRKPRLRLLRCSSCNIPPAASRSPPSARGGAKPICTRGTACPSHPPTGSLPSHHCCAPSRAGTHAPSTRTRTQASVHCSAPGSTLAATLNSAACAANVRQSPPAAGEHARGGGGNVPK